MPENETPKDQSIQGKDKDEPKENELPVEAEVLEKLPPEARKRFIEMSSFLMSGPMHPPFFRKINEEHITKLIEYSESESKREYKRRTIRQEIRSSLRRAQLSAVRLPHRLFG